MKSSHVTPTDMIEPYLIADPLSPDGEISLLLGAVWPTGLIYWGNDERIDSRAPSLWSIGMPLPIVRVIVRRLCISLDLPRVDVGIDPWADYFNEEVKLDPLILEGAIEISVDGIYYEPQEDRFASIYFDEVLCEGGKLIPVQLVIHELAHHLEFCRSGELSSHGEEFAASLRELTRYVWQLRGLGGWASWATKDCHNAVRDLTELQKYEARLSTYAAKWLAQHGVLDDEST